MLSGMMHNHDIRTNGNTELSSFFFVNLNLKLVEIINQIDLIIIHFLGSCNFSSQYCSQQYYTMVSFFHLFESLFEFELNAKNFKF